MTGKQSISDLQRQLQLAGADVLNFGDGLTVSSTPTEDRAAISTGCPNLDAWFPRGGLVPGQTIEIVSSALASGATYLAMILAKQACGSRGLLVVIDRRQDLNPMMLLSLGFDLEHVLMVHPTSEEDHLWALEQSLGDPSVAAVWTRIDKLDKRYQRRWQLAAERGQTIGILQRPEKVLGHPTWALLQVEVRCNPHSDWLVGNQRVVPGRAPHTAQDNWIVDLIARRCPGRFEQPTLRLELQNRVWHEPAEDLEATHGGPADLTGRVPATAGGSSESGRFMRHRPVHPNDPWFTKSQSEVPSSDAAAQAQRRPS
jgi:hypothetical protein